MTAPTDPARVITDPVELVVADALNAAGIAFIHESESKDQVLDFYVPAWCSMIECKRFHTERIDKQLSRFPDVIMLQGMYAARSFAAALRTSSQQPGDERVAELKEQIDNLCLQGLELMANEMRAVEAATAAEARIAALEADKAALVEALEPFAEHANVYAQNGFEGEFAEIYVGGFRRSLTLKNLRRARAALDATTTSQERKDG